MRLLLCALLFTHLFPVLEARAADIPEPPVVTVTLEGGPVRMLVTPSGTGPSLADMDAVVHVVLVDQSGVPIWHFPYQDIWLDDTGDGSVSLCRNSSLADANTDSAGHTTISGAMAAGGSTQTGLAVRVLGVAYLDQPVDISVNSPDHDGNLVVDIADLGQLGVDYAGPYRFRWDLTHDGSVDLSDVASFARHFGDTCP